MMETALARQNRAAKKRAVAIEMRRIRAGSLDRIRSEIKAIEARKAELLSRVRAGCRLARGRLEERIRERKAEARAALAREIEEMRLAARARCKARKAGVRAVALSERRKKRIERAEVLEAARAMAKVDRIEALRKKRLEKREAAEGRRESDDEVRANIAPDLLPIFDRVKRAIRGRPGISRTEVFLSWVDENPDEVWQIHERAAEAKLRALLREERRAARDLKACGGRCKHSEEVPF